jgi:hypothetical protein
VRPVRQGVSRKRELHRLRNVPTDARIRRSITGNRRMRQSPELALLVRRVRVVLDAREGQLS